MAQRQFRSDDTSAWNYGFGDDSDGDYAPSTGTDAPIDSACTGTGGTKSLSATNASFAAGQLILIHQTRGTGVGQWELNKIDSYAAGTITTVDNLIYSYASGAQVLVMPQYSSGLIDTGVTLTAKAYNGTVGGIYAKFCNGTFSIVGTLTMTGKGFTPGGSVSIGGQANQGFGTPGSGGASTAANGNGGGGALSDGGNHSGGGGGGGNGASGAAGAGDSGGTGGAAGGSVGNASLVSADFGGAGGGGARGAGVSGTPGAGSNGGGFGLIISKIITVTGSLPNGGVGGVSGSSSGGGGGGGGGGSWLFKGQELTLGSNLVTAPAGAAGGGIVVGGAGGVGRIHADYKTSITGTTTPTINTTQDDTLNPVASAVVQDIIGSGVIPFAR